MPDHWVIHAGCVHWGSHQGAKLLFDAILTAELAREEWRDNKALCEYCQVATLASFASLAIAIPEITRAVQTLSGQSNA